MAEGLLRHLGQGRVEVHSAGTRPGSVHPLAVLAMAEIDIDLDGHRSKHVQEFQDAAFDEVITVCDNAAESCPVFPGPTTRTHWSLPDPAAVEGEEPVRLEAFRRVRDTLEDCLRRRLHEWEVQASEGSTSTT